MECYRVSKFLVYKVFFPEVSETFDLLDVDRDGKLSRIEIAALLRQIIREMMSELMFEFQNSQCWADSSWIGLYLWRNGYWKWVSVAKINFDIKEKISGTGKITKEDFISYMRSPPVRRTTFRELETWFRRYDADGDGAVTEGNLLANSPLVLFLHATFW